MEAMDIFVNLSRFAIAVTAIWITAGYLIDIVNRIAHRFRRSSFALSFFILGVLTSVSEISVAVNSTLDDVPQVSAGNLIGASLVLILFVVPFLAITGGGIRLADSFSRNVIILAGLVIVSPSLVILDGRLNVLESVGLALFYAALLFAVHERSAMKHAVRAARRVISAKHISRSETVFDIVKLIAGAAIIFFAARVLVQETIFFSLTLSIPSPFIALLILSIGTNVPELVIAGRAVVKMHKEIAFGDYMGSAAMNTLVFGGLGIVSGGFSVERTEFIPTFVMLAFGLVLFIVFCNSKRRISRSEGYRLLAVYGVYILWQLGNLTRFLSD